MKYQTGNDFAGNNRAEPGWYHCAVTDATENPAKRDGSLITDAIFRLTTEIVAGTDPNEVGKQIELTFFNPDPTNKDGGAFGQKINDRALLALDLVDESQKQSDLEIDIRDAIGRQLVVHVDLDKKQKYLRLDGADIFHVDDPAVKQIPKNEAMLNSIPAQYRRIGNRKPSSGVPSTTPVAAPATSSAPVSDQVWDDV